MKFRQFLYYFLIVLLLVVFIGSGIKVGSYFIDAKQQKEEYDVLADMVAQAKKEPAAQPAPTNVPSSPDPTGPTEPPMPTEPTMLPEYVPVYEENSDLVGWLYIEDTPINYPVMQTPDRPNYYLERNFKGERNAHGCLYARETCDINRPSDNITIYGHHMKNGSMFASLDKFTKKSYWETNHSITFDTLYEHHTYTIFAVFTTSANSYGFAYHQFEDAATPEEFDAFVAKCKSLAFYDTGITPQYGDKLICLSTCEYTHSNGRLVVVAVRDPEGPNF